MSTAVAVQKNPFPGLRPFKEDEDYLFFGRENQVDAMVTKLEATRLLAVVGTSGSGKSSLVNCGLRPALRTGLMPRAGTAWRMAQFRPGSTPLRAMADKLAEDGVLFNDYPSKGLSLSQIVDTTLRMSKLGLVDIYEQAHLGKDVNLLVVVDQFEELFRYRHLGADQQDDEATAFITLLLEAAQQTTYPIYVVLTMRSDFLGDCAQLPGLAEAINAGQYLVPRMDRNERRAAIAGPVGVGGAEISPVLLTRLVNDVGDNPDQLSILQHALNRTWDRWQNDSGGQGPLEMSHYESIGTMAHALDQHAENAYDELDAAQQTTCEKLFKALTDKATDPRGVRRPTKLKTLCALAGATQGQVAEVIEVFRHPSRSFLMPPAGEDLGEETDVDISHESLMRVWNRLKIWADQEADSARTYQRLLDRAREWDKGEAELLGSRDLDNALAWREREQPTAAWTERYGGDFELAELFFDKSAKAKEEREEEERRHHLQRQRQLIAVIVVIAIAALAATVAWRLAVRAEAQSDAILKVYQDSGDTLAESADLGVFETKKRLEAAFADFESFIEDGRNPPDLRQLLAATYFNTGTMAEAQLGSERISFYERAREIQERLLTAKLDAEELRKVKADLAFTINKIGAVHLENERLDEASKAFEEAAELRQQLAVVANAEDEVKYKRLQASSLMNLGNVELSSENYPEALEWYKKANDIRAELLTNSQDSLLLVDHAKGQLNEARVLIKLKEYKKARDPIAGADEVVDKLLAMDAASPDYRHSKATVHLVRGEVVGKEGYMLKDDVAKVEKHQTAVSEYAAGAQIIDPIVKAYPANKAYAGTQRDIDAGLTYYRGEIAKMAASSAASTKE